VLPGLIDIHNHGACGSNYSFDSDFRPARIYAAREGVTSVLASPGGRPLDELIEQTKNILSNKDESCGAKIIGIHYEGPFISESKKGAMKTPDDIPTVESFIKLVEVAGDFVKIMTIAAEVQNATEIIKEGKKRGIRMSLGHTDATYDEAMGAIEAGAVGATHTFNAMRSLLHRDPGVLGAVLTDDRVSCEVICDMVHLAPAIVKLIYAAKGSDNFIIISDNGAQTGLPDGDYKIGEFIKTIKNGVCTVNEGKTIAGSMQSMSSGARNLIKLGIPLSEVSKMGSYNPALAISMEKEIGSIDIGMRADIIVVDESFNVGCTFIDGELFEEGAENDK
jgi:N-acetylglucosamine-6-phosphate deacetylase